MQRLPKEIRSTMTLDGMAMNQKRPYVLQYANEDEEKLFRIEYRTEGKDWPNKRIEAFNMRFLKCGKEMTEIRFFTEMNGGAWLQCRQEWFPTLRDAMAYLTGHTPRGWGAGTVIDAGDDT